MTLSIKRVTASLDGGFLVNMGDTTEIHVSIDPIRAEPNAQALIDWLRENKAERYVPTLDELKVQAMAEARANAVRVRHQIAGQASIERALSWVLKSMFASIWQVNDRSPNQLLQPMADVAAQGFKIETDLTGEDPAQLRDRSIQKVSGFFLALQLVEGMERVAETQITSAATAEALDATVAHLRQLETQALAQLASLGG